MKITTCIISVVAATGISLSAFALPTITVIHKAAPYEKTGYLSVKIGAFRICNFQDNAPIQAGSKFVIDLNDIAKYTQVGTDCTQKKIAHMLKGPTSYSVSVYYPRSKLQSAFQSACHTQLIRGRDQQIVSVVEEYSPSTFFRRAGLLSCGFKAVK